MNYISNCNFFVSKIGTSIKDFLKKLVLLQFDRHLDMEHFQALRDCLNKMNSHNAFLALYIPFKHIPHHFVFYLLRGDTHTFASNSGGVEKY